MSTRRPLLPMAALFPGLLLLWGPLSGCKGEEMGCGDSVCDAAETCYLCPDDCGTCTGDVCGDGQCGTTESCVSCAADCGFCLSCGDGSCSGGESCVDCPLDCGGCIDVCGDDICGQGESCLVCPADCGTCRPGCPNGTCDGIETCESCPQDCGVCTNCGDSTCDADETCESCAQDCGACPAECGNSSCESGETCENCPQDCGACPTECGDGTCEGNENYTNCPEDCDLCDWSASWAAKELQILDQINQFRSQPHTCGTQSFPAAPPLSMDAHLRCAARWHSEDMGAQDYFDHDSMDGRTFMDRINDAGFTGDCPCGENIAAGNSGATDTMQQWINSPGHCVNMMSADFTTIGIGYANDGGSTYGHYWTQDFGN